MSPTDLAALCRRHGLTPEILAASTRHRDPGTRRARDEAVAACHAAYLGIGATCRATGLTPYLVRRTLDRLGLARAKAPARQPKRLPVAPAAAYGFEAGIGRRRDCGRYADCLRTFAGQGEARCPAGCAGYLAPELVRATSFLSPGAAA